MSATGRSDVRLIDDAYETPGWCVERLLDVLDLPDGCWLEPCAGNGAIIQAVKLYDYAVNWTAVEKRPECEAALRLLTPRVRIEDFLSAELEHREEVVITNPPYSLAEEFVKKSLGIGQWVIMLLRLNWLASQRRAAFMLEHPPDVYVLPNRPSFTGKGTDATEYAWFVWPPDRKREYGSIQVLSTTPRENRR